MLVYVLKQNGQPFMPTERFGKVRRLLKEGKAKVVRREPFTIKLLYEPETDVVQECYCGVDTGSRHGGYTVLMDIFGNNADFNTMPKGYRMSKLSNCVRVCARKSILYTKQKSSLGTAQYTH